MRLEKKLRLRKIKADLPVRKNTQSGDIKMRDSSDTTNSLAQDKYPWGIRKTGKSNSRFDYM